MQISSTPTAYGGSEAQRLLNMVLQQQQPSAGQDLPSDATTAAAAATTNPTTTPAATPTSTTTAAQFASNTLASLLSAQEAQPTPANVAAQIIQAADTNGDGELSLSEVENALNGATNGANASASATALSQAFSQIDTNGDGEISASELTNALAAQNGTQGAQGQQGPQGAHHHHHHAHQAQGGGSAPTSTDLASQILSADDTNGDGQLSLSEIENALGTSASTGLTSAFNSLDTNGDGQLSASELSTGISAFQAAHHRGSSETAQSQSAQPVTA